MEENKADKKFSRVLGKNPQTAQKLVFSFVFIVIIFLLSSYHFRPVVNFDNIKYVKIAGQEIRVELALTKETRDQGLSGRDGLAENSGMLFVFEQPGRYAFWMKGMNFPIDIIWFDEDKKVVHIEKNAQPESYPNTFDPKTNAKYVLEVSAGFSYKNNLKAGDSVEFIY